MKAMVLDACLLIMMFTRISYISTLVPPENITVSCHNFQTRVCWTYKHNILQLQFKLNITSESIAFVGETTENHYDLTNVLWLSSPLDRYVVLVTAVVGTEASKPRQAPLFTFNDVKTADVKCVLEFPPVNWSVVERRIEVSFENPWFYYKQLVEFPLPDKVLTYKVLTENISPEIHTCTSAICKSVAVLQRTNGSYCVQLNGWISGLANGGRILLNKTAPKCILDPGLDLQLASNYISFVVLIAVFMAVGVVVTIMVFKSKAWEAKVSTLPKALDPFPANSKDMTIMQVTKETVDGCFSGDESADDGQPHDWLLQLSEQEYDGRLMEEDEDEEASFSGYDRVHNLKLMVEMAPNDMITGYGQN